MNSLPITSNWRILSKGSFLGCLVTGCIEASSDLARDSETDLRRRFEELERSGQVFPRHPSRRADEKPELRVGSVDVLERLESRRLARELREPGGREKLVHKVAAYPRSLRPPGLIEQL